MSSSITYGRPVVESTLTSQARVLNALMLRDMRTRFGASHWGFVIAVGWPFAHMLMIVAIMAARGMPTPLGHSLVLFVCTGVIPFIGFMYMGRKMMESVLMNRPLLFFPQVKTLDLLTARAILEIIIFFASTVLCLIFLFLCGIDPVPAYPAEAVYALLVTIFVSIGVGMMNACIVTFFEPYAMGYVLIQISLYTLSGVFYVPEYLPQIAYDILSYNPLLHCIMWFRSAYYPGYGSGVEKSYAILCGATFMVIGLTVDRFIVRRLAK